MSWIPHPTLLEGPTVQLLPLDAAHFDELERVAADRQIWEFYSVQGWQPGRIRKALETALLLRAQGMQYPFSIFYKPERRIIGSTRLTDLLPEHLRLEIGWTWLHPDYWHTGINPECKLLLLDFCFDGLGTRRVQLRTDVRNLRSQRAIQKIGGVQEGIFRNDMIRDDGSRRDSVYYSIIGEEWPEARLRLAALTGATAR